MSTTIIVKAEVDTGNSADDLIAVEKGIDEIVGASKGLDTVDKRFETLNKRLESGEMSIREMGKAVKEYQTIALQAGQDSPIGQEAIQRAAQLSDELGDLNAKVKNLGNDGKNMQAALQLSGVVVSGYTAFQGVTAMLGTENEDLLKIITKLQAAQGTLAAIEQVRAALEKESFLMLKLKNIQLELQNKNLGQLAVQLLKNPWTLAAAGIAALGVALYNLTKIETTYEAAVKKSKEETERLIAQLDKRTSIAVRGIDDEIASLKAAGKETFEQEKYKQELIARTSEARLRLLKRQRDAERAAFNEQVEEFQNGGALQKIVAERIKEVERDKNSELYKSRKALNDQIKQAEQENHDAIQALKNLEISHDKENNDKAVANYKQAQEEKKKTDEEARKKREEDQASFRKMELEADEIQREAFLEKREQRMQEDFAASQLKFDQEQERIRQQEAAEEAQFQNRLARANKIFDISQMGLNSIVSLEKSIFEITNNLGKQDEKNKLERAKRQFNVQKAVNIAQAGIDGAKAITKGIAEFGPPPSPLGIAAIISAGAITGLQIAAIASKRFDGGSSGGGNAPVLPSAGGGGGTGGDIGNTREQGQQTNTAQFFQNQNPQVQKVVLLETEALTDQQKRLSDIVKRSEV